MENKNKTNKFKLFLENFLVYGLGGALSHLVPLIMLPIITSLLPETSDFGISDLSTTAISFASALAILGMYDAMYRLFFEKDEDNYKRKVCSTAFSFTVITSIIVTLLMLIGKEAIADLFFHDKKYAYLIYIIAMATLVSATNSIVAAPTRMQNKRIIYLTANIVGPILSYAIAIPLVVNGYYIIALPLAQLISAATVEISFGILNRKWFSIKLFDRKVLKQLLIIGVPLLPNFLIYWVFSSSDKLMITRLIGLGASGVYSVGAKLGQISQLIYTAFAGGWQFFAFSTMKEKNQVQSNSMIFEYLGVISFFTSAFVFAFSKIVFKLVFSKEYFDGYIVAPYLFLAPLLQMLFQVVANQFLIIKKTWPNMIILSFGAIVNVILNLTLIPSIGIEGAAIATLVGYICSDIVCCIVLCKMGLLIVSRRFLSVTLIMTCYIVLWRIILVNTIVFSLIGALFVGTVMVFLYRNDLVQLLDMIKQKKKNK